MVTLKKINAKNKCESVRTLSDDEMKNIFGGYSYPMLGGTCTTDHGAEGCHGECPPVMVDHGTYFVEMERTCIKSSASWTGQEINCICVVLDEYSGR